MRKKLTTEEIESKQNRILETAMRLLMEEDYRGITIRRITSGCGMATGTFFNYFSSKENLFMHLLYSRFIEHFQEELERLSGETLSSYDDYVRFMLEGAKDMLENHHELNKLYFMHHEILSTADPERVPKELNERYLAIMNELAEAIHAALPVISPTEALRNYSFFYAHMIGSEQLAPIPTLGDYYPAWFDVKTETLHAFERYLEGTRKELI